MSAEESHDAEARKALIEKAIIESVRVRKLRQEDIKGNITVGFVQERYWRELGRDFSPAEFSYIHTETSRRLRAEEK